MHAVGHPERCGSKLRGPVKEGLELQQFCTVFTPQIPDHAASHGNLDVPEIPVPGDLVDGKNEWRAENDPERGESFPGQREQSFVGIPEHFPGHEALRRASIGSRGRGYCQLHDAGGIVHPNEDTQEIGLECEAIGFPAFLQIRNPVTIDPTVQELDPLGRMIRAVARCDQSDECVAKGVVDVTGSASVTVGDGIADEEDSAAVWEDEGGGHRIRSGKSRCREEGLMASFFRRFVLRKGAQHKK